MSQITVTYPIPPAPQTTVAVGQFITGVNTLLGLNGNITTSQFMAALVAALPTSDPHVVGSPWLNGEVISISQG